MARFESILGSLAASGPPLVLLMAGPLAAGPIMEGPLEGPIAEISPVAWEGLGDGEDAPPRNGPILQGPLDSPTSVVARLESSSFSGACAVVGGPSPMGGPRAGPIMDGPIEMLATLGLLRGRLLPVALLLPPPVLVVDCSRSRHCCCSYRSSNCKKAGMGCACGRRRCTNFRDSASDSSNFLAVVVVAVAREKMHQAGGMNE
jgi:hypothetical protein